MARLAWYLARRILKRDIELASLPVAVAQAADAIAADLEAFPGRSLIVAGRNQPPEVHAIAIGLNQALGALGSTLTLQPLVDAVVGSTEALARLAGRMTGGEIETLAILGGNPVYDAPADLELAS